MNLVARPLEQAIRRAARRALAAEPPAWREFVRRRQRVKLLVLRSLAALGSMALPGVLLVSLKLGAPPVWAGNAALLLLLGVCVGVIHLAGRWTKRVQLLERLPVADRDIFRVAWRDLVRTVIWFLPGLWCFCHWFVSGGARGEILVQAGAALLLAGTLLATVCVAMAWLQAGRWAQPLFNLGWLAWLFGLFTSRNDDGSILRVVANQVGTCVRLATPPGWVLNWFLERAAGEAGAAWWLVPVAAVFAAAWPAWRRLREAAAVPESGPRLPQMTPAQAMQVLYVARNNQLPVPRWIGLTAITDGLRAREFLRERPGLDAGWLARWIFRWLTGRERMLVDFMALVRPDWTKHWRVGLASATGGLVLGELLRAVRPEYFWLVSVAGGVGLLGFALPVSNRLSRAFGMCPVAGGAPLPLVACLPVGYAELFRVDWKISVVRSLAALPVAMAFGSALAWQFGITPWLGCFVGVKATGFILSLRPVLLSLQFSMGTNDTQLSKVRGWGMFAAKMTVLFATLVVGAISVPVPKWWSLISLAAVALLGWGFHRWHRRCYDRMAFDLQPSTFVGQYPVG